MLSKDFLRRFIEEMNYLQNQPLKTEDFIEFCKKRGIETNKSELEFFEKKKLLFPIIRIEKPIIEEEYIKFINVENQQRIKHARYELYKGEKEIERFKRKHYSIVGFSIEDKDYLLYLLSDGYLFDPSTKPFFKWFC